jgi:sugar/nucleoside kinase (ribokinase family)
LSALFVGHSCIDVTMVTDVMPSGDAKMVARDYAISFGGNAVTSAFASNARDEKVIDTSGANDVFHGAYLASYLANRTGRWADHFNFARAGSTFKVRHLGNEAGLPTAGDIEDMRRLNAADAV